MHSPSSSVPIVTPRLPYSIFSPTPPCHVRLCIIHSLSSRSLKSSLACAPLLSVRVSAALLVCTAFVNRFRSSSVSMRSEFQIRLRSVTRRSLAKSFSTCFRVVWPEDSDSSVRNTAVVRCIVSCIFERKPCVGEEPEECRMVSISRIESRPMSGCAGTCLSDGA